jgi:signal peptidase II
MGPDGGKWILIALAVAISLGLLWWSRGKTGWLEPLAIGVIVGGALGNAYDRVIYGAVADFLNMSCCGIRNPFAFNVADIMIFVGAIFLILFSDREPRKGDAPEETR